MARFSKVVLHNTARSLGLMLANVGATYIVLSRSSESVYNSLRPGGRQLLDIHPFPSDITLAVSYVTAVLIALIGSRFTRQRLVLTYAACLAWAVGIHVPLQTRWDYEILVDGRINSKVQVIVFGVLVLWVASWWHERVTGGSDRGQSSEAHPLRASSG
jgi:hypothetical protein